MEKQHAGDLKQLRGNESQTEIEWRLEQIKGSKSWSVMPVKKKKKK